MRPMGAELSAAGAAWWAEGRDFPNEGRRSFKGILNEGAHGANEQKKRRAAPRGGATILKVYYTLRIQKGSS